MKRNLILLLFLIFVCFRLININANPPSNLSTSAGIFVDEMHNVHEVRNKVLFGLWKMDKYPSVAYSPIFAYLQYTILSVIGVGLWQIKMLPVILSIFSLFLVYKSFKEYFGYRYGLFSVILLGFNYTFIMYNRLGLYENLVIFFMILTLFFWQRALKMEMPVYFFLTGITAVCVFIAKNIALYFVVSTVLCSLLYCFKKRARNSLKLVSMLLFGVSIGCIIWYFGYYMPYKEEISKLGSSWINAFMSTSNIFRKLCSVNPIFLRFRFLPITFGLAIVSFFVIIYKFLKNPLETDILEIFILLWFLGGLFFLTLLSYNPTRYYLPILPSIILAASVGLVRFGYRKELNILKPPNWRFYLISFLGTVLLLFYFFIPYLKKFKPQWGEFFLINELSRGGDFIVSVVIGLFLTFCIKRWFSWKETKGARRILNVESRQVVSVIIVILILIVNLFSYSRWVMESDYSILEASVEIGKMLPEDSLIAGQGVMAVTIENKIRHVQAPNWYEDMKNIFYDYPITHLFLSHYARYIEWYKEYYPLVMEYSEVIAKYRIWNNDFYLFEINIPEEKKMEAYRCR